MENTNTPAAAIKFNKHHVTNGIAKARVRYSLDGRLDGQICVWIFPKDYVAGDALAQIIPASYVNNTDSQQDYFDKGHVVLFQSHPLYPAARARAEAIHAA